MKINEVQNFYQIASKRQIRSLLESTNKTGINTEILAEIVYNANHEEVWETVDISKLFETLGKKYKYKIFEDTKADNPAGSGVVFQVCPEFWESVELKKTHRNFKNLLKNLKNFITRKKESPFSPTSIDDRVLSGGSIIAQEFYPFPPKGPEDKKKYGESLKHVSIMGNDVKLFYSVKGNNPAIIKLFGIYKHGEIGTSPDKPNVGVQRGKIARFSNQLSVMYPIEDIEAEWIKHNLPIKDDSEEDNVDNVDTVKEIKPLLSDQEANAALVAYMQGLTAKEVGEMLGLTEKQIQQEFSRLANNNQNLLNNWHNQHKKNVNK